MRPRRGRLGAVGTPGPTDWWPAPVRRDALAGDSTLFIRADEADEAWRILDALEAAWASVGLPVLYPAGSAGPAQ